ncbi:hypothetical protein O181_068970 [Austropuccinia psidii MF-1]|uniref:Uncharacterized protein n=1 Tax=Austropuccinia psidii MF-1 TaxID=1389203 RepID=A0A9Q3I7K9_9BASI|nr:hypothetical protein [Austropuccinia psidii MF-1]
MASFGHFDAGQTYDGYKVVEVLYPACTECLAKGNHCFQHLNLKSSKFHFCFVGKKPCHFTGLQASNFRRYFWSKKDGPFGKEFPVSGGPTPDSTSGYSDRRGMWQDGKMLEVPSQLVVDAEDSHELDGDEVEVVNNPVGQQSSTSLSQPPAKSFHSFLITSTPRDFQPNLAAIPPSLLHPSPRFSHTRPTINPAVRPSLIEQSRASRIVNSTTPT